MDGPVPCAPSAHRSLVMLFRPVSGLASAHVEPPSHAGCGTVACGRRRAHRGTTSLAYRCGGSIGIVAITATVTHQLPVSPVDGDTHWAPESGCNLCASPKGVKGGRMLRDGCEQPPLVLFQMDRRPAQAQGMGREYRVGVDRHGMVHLAEQGQIIMRIAIKPAAGKVLLVGK